MLKHDKDIREMSNKELIGLAIRESDITLKYIREHYDVYKLERKTTIVYEARVNVLDNFINNKVYTINDIVAILKKTVDPCFRFTSGEWETWPTLYSVKEKEVVATESETLKTLQIALKQQVEEAYREQIEYNRYLELKKKYGE